MWVLMELVVMATDLAEFLGAALGFQLLFGMPLWIAGILTAIVTFLILGLDRFGFRPLEIVIGLLIGVVAVSLPGRDLPRPAGLALGRSIIPWCPVRWADERTARLRHFGRYGHAACHLLALWTDPEPHRHQRPAQMQRLFRFEFIDVLVAMGLASLINMAMLIMAASTFYDTGMSHVATIEDAISPSNRCWGGASVIFAVSLLASGLSSSSVGTMAGQIIMQGFLHWHIAPWLRRLITMAPALIVIMLGWIRRRRWC